MCLWFGYWFVLVVWLVVIALFAGLFGLFKGCALRARFGLFVVYILCG